jgi:hypothetical protein
MKFNSSVVSKFSGPGEGRRGLEDSLERMKKYLLDCSVANISVFLTKRSSPGGTHM